MVRYQIEHRSSYLRPLTVFACREAVTDGEANDDDGTRVAAAVELFAHYATILDDILDRDRFRHGKLSLHCRFGRLPALMVSAYFAFAAGELIAHDSYATRVFANVGKRMSIVECRQWRLRRRPFGLDTWREVAGEATGAVFEGCSQVATRDDRFARFGYLLGTLYQACDDVADLRQVLARAAGEREITDRVLTLPAAIATEDPATAQLFAQAGSTQNEELAARLIDALPEAESMLDAIAEDCEREARRNSSSPGALVALARWTRELSTR